MESDGKRTRSNNDKVGIAEELIQALTAARNYLAVLDSIIRSESGLAQDRLSETLDKGISQVERATVVARRLPLLSERRSSSYGRTTVNGSATSRVVVATSS
jgi:hypothetical protein